MGRLPAIFGVLLIAVFAIRAGYGVVGGYGLRKGVTLAEAGQYEEALPLLELADVGFQRNEALQWRARTRISVWRRARSLDELGDDPQKLLRESAADYLRAASASPAAAWPWAGLANVYRNAGLDEAKRVGPSAVARPVGIELGLLRRSIEASPNDAYYMDELALTFRRLGFRELALEAVRAAARVRPVYTHHAFRFLRPEDPEIMAAFAEASKEVLGETPMLPRFNHLLELGKLEHRRGEYENAERLLNQALLDPASDIFTAEVHYWLGLALFGQRRLTEAREVLELSAEVDPVFEPGAYARIAEIDVLEGELENALETLRRVRRLQPRNVQRAIRFAEIARELGDQAAAGEALRWAVQLSPNQLSYRIELFEVYLADGNTSAARRLLRQIEKREPPAAEMERLRRMLDETSIATAGG
ncbi:hypothetical protein ABI59_04760 [Acidobacteria bacterium Mor1]|nr:hypothetical protein ABI59_04760 [Acidobacteria bacterium Mor1]